MGGVLEVERMNEFFKQLGDIGREVLETVKHRAKLRTIFDIYTEKVIPTFVNEKELKEHYKKRMEEVNDFIYKL
jgi:hypothetical protein